MTGQRTWRPQVTVLAVVSLSLALSACSGAPRIGSVVHNFILHLEYRGGGDAPVGFLLTVLENDRVRLYSPHWKEYWSRLSSSEATALRGMLASPELRAALALAQAESPEFGCCDLQEVGVWLSSGSQPVSIPLESGEVPAAVGRLFEFVNSVASRHFGSRFAVPMPNRGPSSPSR